MQNIIFIRLYIHPKNLTIKSEYPIELQPEQYLHS